MTLAVRVVLVAQVVLPCISSRHLLQRSKERERVGCENCPCGCLAAASWTRVDAAALAQLNRVCDINNILSVENVLFLFQLFYRSLQSGTTTQISGVLTLQHGDECVDRQ